MPYGITKELAMLKHPFPKGINIIVIKNTSPIPQKQMAKGNLIHNQNKAVNKAPVILNPIQNKTDRIPNVIINPNIFFLLSKFYLIYFKYNYIESSK